MKVVNSFCIKPYSEPGKKRSSAEHVYDWTYLVRQISYFDSGKACDDAAATEVAKVLRKACNFPNDSDWKTRVNFRLRPKSGFCEIIALKEYLARWQASMIGPSVHYEGSAPSNVA